MNTTKKRPVNPGSSADRNPGKNKEKHQGNSRTRRNAYGAGRFRQRIHSRKGMTVTAVSACLIGLYLVFVLIAYVQEGNVPVWYGCLGVPAVPASFVCLIQAISSKRERYRFPLFPNLALAGSLISCLLWIGTYCLGFAL